MDFYDIQYFFGRIRYKFILWSIIDQWGVFGYVVIDGEWKFYFVEKIGDFWIYGSFIDNDFFKMFV